jgi:flagellar biosynthesis protein FliR
MAQVVLGLLAKAAPQLNVFVLGLPFQVLLTLALIGIGIRLLPDVIVRLVEMSVSDMGRLAHAL